MCKTSLAALCNARCCGFTRYQLPLSPDTQDSGKVLCDVFSCRFISHVETSPKCERQIQRKLRRALENAGECYGAEARGEDFGERMLLPPVASWPSAVWGLLGHVHHGMTF